MSDRTCSIEGCASSVVARGWCSAHYQRWQRHGDPLAKSEKTPASKGLLVAFIAQAVASSTDECIIWPYGRDRGGYGHLRVDGRTTRAHRLVLERTSGPAPSPGMDAAHAPLICHNRACINPRHLRWATRKQNSDDAVIDGVASRGERHGNSKLTAHQVLALFRDRRPHAVVAAELGVTEANIRAIRSGRSWAWLTHTSKEQQP